MNISYLPLPVCNMSFPGQIDINRIECFTLKPTRPNQLSQRMFGLHMQDLFEFTSRVARFRIVDQGLGCIDKVSENCEYICGVGADFYFPDQQDREFNNIEDPDELEIRVAQKGDKKFR